MPQTGFDPRRHGFGFTNRWRLDEGELRLVLDRLSNGYKQAAKLGWSALGILGLRSKIEHDLAEGFGLCGGMCFAALDFFKTGFEHSERACADPPPVESPLHAYIAQRQAHSLVHLGSMSQDGLRYAAWFLVLNRVPERLLRGGPGWLLRRSRREWSKLQASIDGGQPTPILIARDTDDFFGNHQVLATGYEWMDQESVTIQVYDPNCPGQVNTIEMEFEDERLSGRESCGDSPPLAGFFCQAYRCCDPAAALG